MSDHTDLEIARARRAALQGRLVRLTSERKRLDGIERAESTARTELDALGRAEVDAVRAWAATASSDPAPKPDAARRHELTIAVAGSEAQSAAARSAGLALDVEIGEVSRDLAHIAGQIEAAAIDDLFGRFAPMWAAIDARAAELRRDIGRALALTEALRDRADGHEQNGRPEIARPIFRRLEPFYASMRLDFNPTRAEVNTAVPEWVGIIADLAR
jgi:hypothetical protein